MQEIKICFYDFILLFCHIIQLNILSFRYTCGQLEVTHHAQ